MEAIPDNGSQTARERLAAYYERVRPRGARSPEAIAEADEEGKRRKAAGSTDWVDRYGFGAEDDIWPKGT